jgi:hypothetical protein
VGFEQVFEDWDREDACANCDNEGNAISKSAVPDYKEAELVAPNVYAMPHPYQSASHDRLDLRKTALEIRGATPNAAHKLFQFECHSFPAMAPAAFSIDRHH